MKYLYRISLIFMILTILSACILGGYYFYQSQLNQKKYQEQFLVTQETSVIKDTTDCDTEYVILMQNLAEGGSDTVVKTIPGKYINKTKEQLVELLKEEERAPALQDRERGLESIRLSVFSNERVVVVKTYRKEKEALSEELMQEVMGTNMKPVNEQSVSQNQVECYYLMAKAGYVAVYNSDMKTMYLATGILMSHLPDELQQEILDKKYIKNEEELYNFLESYSS